MDATDRRRRASAEAADWFVRLQSANLPREERARFVEWLRESHIHVAELIRITQVHSALEQFESWSRILVEGSLTSEDTVIQLPPLRTAEEREEQPQRVRDATFGGAKGHNSSAPLGVAQHGWAARLWPRGRIKLLAIAATVAGLLVAAAILLPQIRGQFIDTDRGERREVVLSDGSVLQVDPETRVRVQYDQRVRRVSLEHGRALFHVAKSPNRPFLVQADDTIVRAVGTAFGVDRRSQGVIITVAEGQVSVTQTQSRSPSTPGEADESSKTGAPHPPGNGTAPGDQVSQQDTQTPQPRAQKGHSGRATLFLVANQQVIVGRSGAAEPVRSVDSHRELAWAEGRLIFRDDTVTTVVADFNRYNRVQIRVEDPTIANRPISGVFNASEPDAFIAFLQSVATVEIVRDGDRSITIVSGRDR